MAVPPNAKTWGRTLDPTDLGDYVASLVGGTIPLLQDGETFETYTLVPSAEAVALGLTIGDADGYEPVADGETLTIWLSIDEALRGDAAFDGEGVSLPLELTVETDSSPPRRWQRTLVVRVAHQ
jgi:hypothetical protein